MTTTSSQEMADKIAVTLQHLSEGGALKDLARFTPEELDAVYTVAHSYFAARKYDDAIQLFTFLTLYDHLEPRWHYSMGVAFQAKGEYEAAAQSYATATLLNVDDPRPQAQAGYCLMALGMWDNAEKALRTAMETCAENPEYADVKKQASELLETVEKRERQ